MPPLIRKKDIPRELAILPLRNEVLFPAGVLPLAIGRLPTIALVLNALREDALIGVVTQQHADTKAALWSDLFAMGTVSRIVKLVKLGEETYSLVVQGLARFRVLEGLQDVPYLMARAEPAEDTTSKVDAEVEVLVTALKKLGRERIQGIPDMPAEATELVDTITHPGHLADLIAANVDLSVEAKLAVLETVELKPRMRRVLELLTQKESMTPVGPPPRR
jgi:ATP-dependent Lon protease